MTHHDGSARQATLVSPHMDLAVVPRPTGAYTPSRCFAQALADTFSKSDLHKFDRALQNVELATDAFRLSTTNRLHGTCAPGATVLDSIGPCDVLIVYADARMKGGVGIAHPPLAMLVEAWKAVQDLPFLERRRRLVRLAIGMKPRNRAGFDAVPLTDRLAAVAADILSIAALVITSKDVDRLRAVRDAIPALAIVARTETRGRAAADTRHLVTPFPGEYLGTARAAGSA